MKIILFFIALILVSVLGVLSLVFSVFFSLFSLGFKKGFKEIEYLFLHMAISLDQFGNVVCRIPFQMMFTKVDNIETYLFGDEDETVSYVLAVNQKRETLTRLGRWLCWLLDFLDKEHMKKAIITQREKDIRSHKRFIENEFDI